MINLAFLEQEYEIRLNNTGNSEYLSNKGFLSLLEDIGGIHSNIAGLGMNQIKETRLSWVLLGWKVEIFSRPRYATKVKIKTWASHTEKFHTYRDFEVFDETGKKIAIATSKWVLVNIDTGKLTKIEDTWIQKYAPEDVHVFETIELDKLIDPENYSSEYVYTIRRADIDVNQHMHNLNYLDLAYEVLPEDIYENHDFTHIEIMYKKQVRYGDTVKCLYSKESSLGKDTHIIAIKSEDLKNLHAMIRLS